MQDLTTGELVYCIVVLLFTFTLRGSVGFGGAIGLPLLALVIVKTLDAVLLARALGVFVILYALYTIWLGSRPAGSVKPRAAGALQHVASVLSGTVGTLFGSMASIFFAMYLEAWGTDKH